MQEISLERLLPNSGYSIFRLARIAMKRSLELTSGSPALVEHTLEEKAATVAFREISRGKVVGKENALKGGPSPADREEDQENASKQSSSEPEETVAEPV